LMNFFNDIQGPANKENGNFRQDKQD